jgi:3-methyladenine DNA glycosylase/8-oxoguanine DNA glycosylase
MALSSLRVALRDRVAPRGALYDARRVTRAPRVALAGGADPLVAAFSHGDGAVTIELLSARELPAEALERALHAARGLMALDDDPTEFIELARAHPLLRRWLRDRDPRMARVPTVFEAFAEAVLGQLVTSQEARASQRRLWKCAGLLVPGTDLLAAPTAQAVADLPAWKLREIGVGTKRATTLRTGAKRGPALERLRERAPEDAMQALESLPGVGPWTSNGVAASAFGYADAVPLGDLWSPRAVTAAFGGGPDGTDETMLAALAPFRPHRARVVRLVEASSGARAGAGDDPPRRVPRVDKHRRMPWRY